MKKCAFVTILITFLFASSKLMAGEIYYICWNNHPIEQVAGQIELKQNYPNPFNPVTQIPFELPGQSQVHLAVYDVLGQRVAVLVDGMKSAGVHEVNFDATDLASGVYLYRLETGSQSLNRKMLLVK